MAYGVLDEAAKLATRDEDSVDVHAIRIERQLALVHFLVVNRHEHQVDVGFRPDPVVRQAAAQKSGEYRAVEFDLLDQAVEGGFELQLDGVVRHGRPRCPDRVTRKPIRILCVRANSDHTFYTGHATSTHEEVSKCAHEICPPCSRGRRPR
ncbi:MAG: hypothetical protein DMF89_14915 [Acidobacteria bacterium]|nr:MAG: hypothetical protein DMF90_02810 [Acidobacteriota bacterium]PYR48664.1 MAG: hypothetical protein DMF89_14915 [Acidobacteriota bacterium]